MTAELLQPDELVAGLIAQVSNSEHSRPAFLCVAACTLIHHSTLVYSGQNF